MSTSSLPDPPTGHVFVAGGLCSQKLAGWLLTGSGGAAALTAAMALVIAISGKKVGALTIFLVLAIGAGGGMLVHFLLCKHRSSKMLPSAISKRL